MTKLLFSLVNRLKSKPAVNSPVNCHAVPPIIELVDNQILWCSLAYEIDPDILGVSRVTTETHRAQDESCEDVGVEPTDLPFAQAVSAVSEGEGCLDC